MEEVQGTLITVDRLAADFRRLGVQEGMTLLLHSSLKSLGQWVAGGPVAVILALEQVLGEEGTLVMPTQSSDLTDPSGWSRPPVPEAWWPEIREHMPRTTLTSLLSEAWGLSRTASASSGVRAQQPSD